MLAAGRSEIARRRLNDQPIEMQPLVNSKPMAAIKRRILFFTRKLFRKPHGDAR
jgi:hypothetical protein